MGIREWLWQGLSPLLSEGWEITVTNVEGIANQYDVEGYNTITKIRLGKTVRILPTEDVDTVAEQLLSQFRSIELNNTTNKQTPDK